MNDFTSFSDAEDDYDGLFVENARHTQINGGLLSSSSGGGGGRARSRRSGGGSDGGALDRFIPRDPAHPYANEALRKKALQQRKLEWLMRRRVRRLEYSRKRMRSDRSPSPSPPPPPAYAPPLAPPPMLAPLAYIPTSAGANGVGDDVPSPPPPMAPNTAAAAIAGHQMPESLPPPPPSGAPPPSVTSAGGTGTGTTSPVPVPATVIINGVVQPPQHPPPVPVPLPAMGGGLISADFAAASATPPPPPGNPPGYVGPIAPYPLEIRAKCVMDYNFSSPRPTFEHLAAKYGVTTHHVISWCTRDDPEDLKARYELEMVIDARITAAVKFVDSQPQPPTAVTLADIALRYDVPLPKLKRRLDPGVPRNSVWRDNPGGPNANQGEGRSPLFKEAVVKYVLEPDPHTPQEAAEEFNVPVGSVNRWVLIASRNAANEATAEAAGGSGGGRGGRKKQELTIPQLSQKKYSKEFKRKVVEYYMPPDPHTLAQTSEQFGNVPVEHIRDWVKFLMPVGVMGRRRQNLYPKEFKKEVVDYYRDNQHERIKDVAEKFCVNPTRVSTWIQLEREKNPNCGIRKSNTKVDKRTKQLILDYYNSPAKPSYQDTGKKFRVSWKMIQIWVEGRPNATTSFKKGEKCRSKAEIKKIMEFLKTRPYKEAQEKFGVAEATLINWAKEHKLKRTSFAGYSNAFKFRVVKWHIDQSIRKAEKGERQSDSATQRKFGIAHRTLHNWLKAYEEGRLHKERDGRCENTTFKKAIKRHAEKKNEKRKRQSKDGGGEDDDDDVLGGSDGVLSSSDDGTAASSSKTPPSSAAQSKQPKKKKRKTATKAKPPRRKAKSATDMVDDGEDDEVPPPPPPPAAAATTTKAKRARRSVVDEDEDDDAWEP